MVAEGMAVQRKATGATRAAIGAFVAAVVGVAGTLTADELLARTETSESLRLIAVLIAVLSLVPWLTVLLGSVFRSRSDDFIHHVMVFAAVTSLVGAITVAVLGVALERAGFIEAIPLSLVWPVMTGVWGISLLLGVLRYQ